MTRVAAGAVLLALALDAVVGELPRRAHPVAWFGAAVGRVDRTWPHPRLAGALIATLLPLAAVGLAAGSVLLLRAWGAPTAVLGVLAGGWLFASTSRRMLLDRARAVIESAAEDPPRAHTAARALVGRETDTLTAAELRSAAVESAAENLADGLVAPLLAFGVGAQVSLVLGVGAAAWVKAVNTLDSMLGYPGTPHGTASARLDDLVNWLPARLGAVLLAASALDPRALGRATAWARAPASPNAGWPMATLAAIIDCRLTKPGAYTLHETADLPDAARARRGLAVVDRAAVLAFVLAGVGLWF